MTEAEWNKHLSSVGGGPRSEAEIAKAERKYRSRILEGRAEMAAAEFQARRAPGAPPVSNLAGLRASMPAFTQDLASLPEVAPVDAVQASTNGTSKHEPPLDRTMLESLGRLWVSTKKTQGRAQAWDLLEEAIMSNLHRLAPGYGTVKDFIALVRGLDEYSNPVTPKANGKMDKTAAYRKALLMDEE